MDLHAKYSPALEMVPQRWFTGCMAVEKSQVLSDGLRLILAVGEQDDQVQGCIDSMMECVRGAQGKCKSQQATCNPTPQHMFRHGCAACLL